MGDTLDSWRVTPPPSRDLSPAALASAMEARARTRRRRVQAAVAAFCVLVTVGAAAGVLRADQANRAALESLRDAHLAQLGAEVDS